MSKTRPALGTARAFVRGARTAGLAALFLQILLTLFSLQPVAMGQIRRHDPLTTEEADQIRESALEPNIRLKLLVDFAKLRLAKLDEPLKATDSAGRGQEMHDRLDDFALIYDELEDNITMFLDRKEDLRKPLHLILTADEEFAGRLRHLREVIADPKALADTLAESREYSFILTNAADAVAAGLTDHRKLLVEQEELAKQRKHRK